jgi:uncharacterized protein YcgI (DUF1989 family)
MQDPRRIVVPRQSGRSIRVSRGDLVRIIDPKGQQVSDFWAFTTEPALDWLSTSQTRDITERLFAGIGDSFFSAAAKPMLRWSRTHHRARMTCSTPLATAHFTNAPGRPTIRIAATI